MIAGSIGVFWLYVFILRGWTASAASYQFVLITIVTIALSAWFAGRANHLGVRGGLNLGAHRRLLRGAAASDSRPEFCATRNLTVPALRAGAREASDGREVVAQRR